MKKISIVLILLFSFGVYAEDINIKNENFYFDENRENILEIPKNVIANSMRLNRMPTEKELNLIGERYGLPHGLLFAIFWKETQYQCNRSSSKGAKGCFQFIDGTAVKMGILSETFDFRKNPWISADAAARYLLWNFNYLNLKSKNNPENWKYAVAAYNAGANRIKSGDTLRIPMYTETQYYVEDIIGYIKGEKYIVKKGDKFSKISQEYSMGSQTLSLINGLTTNKSLKSGDFLTIKRPSKIYKYQVRRGDNIAKISRYTGIKIGLIGKTNKIKSLSAIEPGQVLYLPIF